MNVEIGRGTETLDQGDSARVGFAVFQSLLLDQKAGDNAADDVQHGREPFGMGGEQDALRDREREHPLAHRHARDEVIDQVGECFLSKLNLQNNCSL